jgi:thiol-disulfide isomerase/thioredoxin
MTVALIDATSNSITVSWSEFPGALKYVLQYRASDDVEFTMLSDKLTTAQARKKNLDAGKQYFFRIGPLRDGEIEPKTWVSHPEPFCVLTEEQDSNRMKAPLVLQGGSNQTVLVQWGKVEEANAYELQMRENVGGGGWSTVAASLSGTEVKKKNLTSAHGYQFRVRVVGSDVFSPPCGEPVIALGLSSGIKSLFKSLEDYTLLKQKDKIPLANALGGKEFILLYASASWCGPCRQFTPTLVKWYQSLTAHSAVEVVFLSADRDEQSMVSYYSKMPWLAVEHTDDAREELMSYIKVTGIPRLVVLDGRTGRTIVDNAVGQQLDVRQWRKLATQK